MQQKAGMNEDPPKGQAPHRAARREKARGTRTEVFPALPRSARARKRALGQIHEHSALGSSQVPLLRTTEERALRPGPSLRGSSSPHPHFKPRSEQRNSKATR